MPRKTKGAAAKQTDSLEDIKQRLDDIQQKRDAASAAFDAADSQFSTDLGAAALGELPAAKLAKSRADRDEAMETLAGLNAAVAELERRLAAASAARMSARKAGLRRDIDARVRAARRIVRDALDLDEQMAGLGEKMRGEVNRISELVDEYRSLEGLNPCEFPALNVELMEGLQKNKSGIRTGTPEFMCDIWASRGRWRSMDHPAEIAGGDVSDQDGGGTG